MKYLEKISVYCNKMLLILGGIAVLALMTAATGNVVLRIVYAPFRGSYEIVSFLGAVVIAFALGYTQQVHGHIVVDILTDKFPKGVSRILDMVNYLVTAAFFTIVAWQLYVWGMKIRETGELSETLKVIYHPFVLATALGFASLSYTSLIQFINVLRGRERG